MSSKIFTYTEVGIYKRRKKKEITLSTKKRNKIQEKKEENKLMTMKTVRKQENHDHAIDQVLRFHFFSWYKFSPQDDNAQRYWAV